MDIPQVMQGQRTGRSWEAGARLGLLLAFSTLVAATGRGHVNLPSKGGNRFLKSHVHGFGGGLSHLDAHSSRCVLHLRLRRSECMKHRSKRHAQP